MVVHRLVLSPVRTAGGPTDVAASALKRCGGVVAVEDRGTSVDIRVEAATSDDALAIVEQFVAARFHTSLRESFSTAAGFLRLRVDEPS